MWKTFAVEFSPHHPGPCSPGIHWSAPPPGRFKPPGRIISTGRDVPLPPKSATGTRLVLHGLAVTPITCLHPMPSGRSHRPASTIRVRTAAPGDIDALMELEQRVFA